MGRGANERGWSDRLSSPRLDSTEVFLSVLASAADETKDFSDAIGSTYALEIPTEWGLAHVLFRATDGDVERVHVEAAYVDGQSFSRLDRDTAALAVTAILRQAPWLIGAE
jgi:hypothetical protein